MYNDRVEKFLEAFVENISISATMIDKATNSYEAVGKWLGDGDWGYDVNIMPQGSFNLGTMIKPLSERDDYDIDLVCLLDVKELSNYDIKNLVGNRLKEHELYKGKLQKEGKRCWTLDYEEFHMDILPCIPMCYPYSETSGNTSIHLTHKNVNNQYETRHSNPAGYQKWFEKRMESRLRIAKESFAVRAKADIKDVPTYRVKTPLQSVVQLLKRHRDMMFKEDENAPISIIITTLAALVYNGELSIQESLSNIADHLTDSVIVHNERYIITNPVQPDENFADKWNEKPVKAKSFFKWHEQLKKDIAFIFSEDLRISERNIRKAFGEKPTQVGIKVAFSANKPYATVTGVPHVVKISTPNRPYGDDLL